MNPDGQIASSHGILQTAAAEGRYAAKVGALRQIEASVANWPTRAKVRVIRNYTLENLEMLLRFECARSEIAAQVSFSGFETFEQEVLDPASSTLSGGNDLVLVSLWLDGLLPTRAIDASDFSLIYERISTLLERVRSRIAAPLVVTSFLPPFCSLGGRRMSKDDGSILAAVDQVNARLASFVFSTDRLYLIDLRSLVARLGEGASLDPRFWYMYRAPLRNELLGLVAGELAAMVSAAKGSAKKVLALDCDNTLWGGIIGEDGLDGISLDPNQFPGSAYFDFHRQVLQLKGRGVVLALCSKNNEGDALAVFDKHPHSLLKKDDFVIWRINWSDKATNLREMAEILNLGLDSFVLVDDSPTECGYVRAALPEVTVLQVPQRVHELTSLLRSYRGFDRLCRSEEDLARTRMYQEEVKREETRRNSADLDAYLRSLDLSAQIRPAQQAEVQRIAQLTQKTNQFNLTTRRYTEGDIERFLGSPDYLVMTMRVRDRFGDYGMTGLAILRFEQDMAEIDTFLMSCRILGRKLEFALLKSLLKEAGRRPGMTHLRGLFLPTRKNQQVEDFFDRAGFTRLANGTETEVSGGSKSYSFELRSSLMPLPDYLSVVS